MKSAAKKYIYLGYALFAFILLVSFGIFFYMLLKQYPTSYLMFGGGVSLLVGIGFIIMWGMSLLEVY